MEKSFTRLCESKDPDALHEICDGTCTAGYDTDGSTGREIYENGLRLGREIGSRPKAELFTYSDGQTVWYFLYEDAAELVERFASV